MIDSSIVSSIYRSGKHYDLFFPRSAENLAPWLALTQRYGGPILEVMSGTGAIAIPIAQQGQRVTGLELAETMLEEARQKSAAAGVEVEWVQGDVRNFELSRQYKLILLLANSICHLLTRDELESTLRCVARHLQPQGRFVVSVFVPSLPLLLKTPQEEQDFLDCVDPDTGDAIVITQRSWYDAATQVTHNFLFKRVNYGPVEPDGELTMRMYFPQELDALFWYNGFEIEHKYGDIDGSPFTAQSSTQVFILKLRD